MRAIRSTVCAAVRLQIRRCADYNEAAVLRRDELWAEKRFNRDKMPGRFHLDGRCHVKEPHNPNVPEVMAEEQRATLGVIRDLGRDRRWEEALKLFQTVTEPHPYVWNTILNACAKSGKVGIVEDIFGRMPVKTTSGYNIMISLNGRLRRVENAERLLVEMKQQVVEPNLATYASLISAYGTTHRVADVMRTLEELRAAQISINVGCYSNAMTACAKAGDKASVQAILQQMEADGMKADVGHCTSVIVACQKHKDDVGAQAALEDMRQRNIAPDLVTYTAVMGCCKGPEALAKARAILDDMRSADIQPDSFVYGQLLAAALASKLPEEFHKLLREMQELGLPETAEIQTRCRQLQQLEREMQLTGAQHFPPPAKLPAGWQETKDPTSGRPYFWKESDPAGSVTWVRPL